MKSYFYSFFLFFFLFFSFFFLGGHNTTRNLASIAKPPNLSLDKSRQGLELFKALKLKSAYEIIFLQFCFPLDRSWQVWTILDRL